MKQNDTIEEVCTMLDNEMNKNSKDRDYEKISELTKTYAVLTDTENEIEQAAQSGIADMLSKIRPEIEEMPEAVPVITHTGTGWFKNVATVAACLAVCAGTIGGISALKRVPVSESVQTAEGVTESVTEASAKAETQPLTEPQKPETQKQVLSAVPETTISTDTMEIMTSAIETEIVPVIQEITTAVTVPNTEAPTTAQTELIIEPTESIIEPTEPEIISVPEEMPETLPAIIQCH